MRKVITIEKPVFGGRHLGFLEGKAVFVRGSIGGETVLADITKETADYCEAEALEILEASPDRTRPICPVYGQCGGCDLQHILYSRQITDKAMIVTDCLRRIARLTDHPEPEIIHASDLYYRSHASLKADGRAMGFHAARSNTIVPLPSEGCALLAPELNRYLGEKKSAAKDFRIAIDSTRQVYCSEQENVTLLEQCNSLQFERSINGFFQANMILRDTMQSLVTSLAGKGRVLLDVACGNGFFSLPCAGSFEKIFGFDVSSASIASAKANARKAGFANIQFSRSSMDSIEPGLAKSATVIIDPPRAGISPAMLSTLINARVRKIVYVSCNPSTWARDIRRFTEGGYSLKKAYMLDMFPQTHHIEMISLIEHDGL